MWINQIFLKGESCKKQNSTAAVIQIIVQSINSPFNTPFQNVLILI